MPSRPRFEAARRRSADRFVRREQNRCSTVCAPGWKTRSRLSRASPIRRGAIRYASSRWQALTRYVDDGHLEIDNNAAERAAAISRCSDQPSSTVSIPNSISIKCSNASPTTQSAGSTHSYRGTYRCPASAIAHEPMIHITLSGYITLTHTHKNGSGRPCLASSSTVLFDR
jgi:hypothetical protein